MTENQKKPAMTENQINQLRFLIQQEIIYALAENDDHTFWNSFAIEEDNNKTWEEFKKSFQE